MSNDGSMTSSQERTMVNRRSVIQASDFLLVVPPLKIRGGSGSALRAFALVPKGGDDD